MPQDQQDQPKPKYAYQRYPLVMHKETPEGWVSQHVASPDDEAAAAADGWRTQRPPLPAPEEEKVAITLEERVQALEDGFSGMGQNMQAMTELLAELTKAKTGGRSR